MRVLLVSNEYTKPGRIGNPIIYRIKDALTSNSKVEEVLFTPFKNTFRSFEDIRNAAKGVDVIHVQFGGLYAFLIWFCLLGIRKPKLLTFHGTDIHAKEICTTKSYLVKFKIWLSQKASFCSILMYDKVGFVTDTLCDYVPKFIVKRCRNKMFVQPLGVDFKLFQPINKAEACKKLNIEQKKYVLFSDKSNTILKRRDIAESIVKVLGKEYDLLIMCGVQPSEVPIYINASDFILLTSDEEGSPNIIREALSLNKRVFSVDVGDVKQQLNGLKNSSIISRNPEEAARVISEKLSEPYSDNTRENLRSIIDFDIIADKLVNIYEEMLAKWK